MKHNTETFSFSGIIKARTAKAILVDTGVEEVWFPLSHVLEIHGDPNAELVVTAWIARQKNLI